MARKRPKKANPHWYIVFPGLREASPGGFKVVLHPPFWQIESPWAVFSEEVGIETKDSKTRIRRGVCSFTGFRETPETPKTIGGIFTPIVFWRFPLCFITYFLKKTSSRR